MENPAGNHVTKNEVGENEILPKSWKNSRMGNYKHTVAVKVPISVDTPMNVKTIGSGQGLLAEYLLLACKVDYR
jgi:hypothetical protein